MVIKMKNLRQFIAIIEKEENTYVSFCPELDIASQGDTIEEARNNLKEAIELFVEIASNNEITKRIHSEVFITQLAITVGQA